MSQHEPELAERLSFAAARLKADTTPPTLGDFPEGTPRAARLRPAGDDTPVLSLAPAVTALSEARGELTFARARLEVLSGELVELWSARRDPLESLHEDDLPPAA